MTESPCNKDTHKEMSARTLFQNFTDFYDFMEKPQLFYYILLIMLCRQPAKNGGHKNETKINMTTKNSKSLESYLPV